jgi:hypothetical protein
VNREQRIWATVAGVLFLLAILGGTWALQRQTDNLKADQHRSDCLLLASQQKVAEIFLDTNRVRTINKAALNAIPSLQDICGATADEILAHEAQRATEGG